MPPTEVCLIHPGGLSASSWSRLASHLPAGTPVRMLELEAINRYWAGDPSLTVEALADRLRPRLAVPRARLLVGWGVGGASPTRCGPREQHVVVLDGLAPGAAEPSESELLRSFAMYVGARRGAALPVDPARLREGLDGVPRAAIAARVLRADTTAASVRRSYQAHVTRVLRDHRLTAEPRALGPAADRREGRAQPRAGQPGAGLGPLRAGRGARQRRRPLLDAHRARARGASGDDAAALARAACQRRGVAG